MYAVDNFGCCGDGGDIYKQTSGTGAFVAQNAGNKLWYSITSTPSGDVYAVPGIGDIYKQTGGTGAFVAQGAGNRYWNSITSTPIGDIYAVVDGGDIYKQTGGTGAFVAQIAGGKNWRSITSTPSGDIYAVHNDDMGNGDIYKQTGGIGAFVAQNAGNKGWASITSTPSGDIYAVDVFGTDSTGGDIYKKSSHPILQRIYTESATTSRSFASTTEVAGEAGHSDWIIIAQRAVGSLTNIIVNLTSASYNLVTNIFKAFIGATFISGSDINGLTSPVVPNITLNLPTEDQTIIKWLPNILWGDAELCEYSYDNWTTTTVTECSLNGGDIVRPQGGANTLYIRATNQYGSFKEEETNFTYDNISPVWTTCGSDLLDESTRLYYYLSSSVTASCTATVDTKLYGNTETTDDTVSGTPFTIDNTFEGNGHSITLKNITVTGITTSNGGTLTIQNATTSDLVVSATSSGANGGTIIVSTSTTGSITANGADGTGNGGNGGSVTVYNSDGVSSGTQVTANGGKSTDCGNGGNAGIINITNSNNYTAVAGAGEGSNRTCSSGGHTSGSTISPPYITTRPVIIPPATPSVENVNVNTNNNSGSGGSSFFANFGKVDLGKLSLSNLPRVSFVGLSTGSNLGTSKFINPLSELLQLQPVTGFNSLPKINWTSRLSKIVINSLPKSLANLSNSVPSIKKELNKAGVVNGYDLYSMKESPVNTPTLGDLAKDKTAQPDNLIFTTVDGKERQTKLSIDGKENIYQIITVEPYASVAINVKNTDKTQSVKTTFDNKTIKSVKDKNNIVKLSLTAPKEEGSYKLKVGTLTLEVRVKTSETSPAPAQQQVTQEKLGDKKLSPIKKMWSWFSR